MAAARSLFIAAGYAAVRRECHTPLLSRAPPACSLWLACVHCSSACHGPRYGAMPCVNMSVVAFWNGAPNAHWWNVDSSQDAWPRSLTMAGYSHTGQCSAVRNARSLRMSPRSAGFSTMNSVPASAAAVRRLQRRSMMSLALASSAAWPGGGGSRPRGRRRVRTGGGPVSLERRRLTR